MRGHAAPAALAESLGTDDGELGMDLPDGARLARCLRCDVWVEQPVPAGNQARWSSLPPLANLPKPRRGKPLHDAILLRVIALERAAHSVAFTILAVALALIETNLGVVHDFARRLVEGFASPVRQSGPGASKSWLDREMAKVLHLEQGTVKLLLATAVIYAVVEGVEAVGLWRERRWAEYLTAVATAGFLPLEIHELFARVTALRVGALVTNVAVLAWLIWNKHLFGVRGGAETLGTTIDWDEVVAHPVPAPVSQ